MKQSSFLALLISYLGITCGLWAETQHPVKEITELSSAEKTQHELVSLAPTRTFVGAQQMYRYWRFKDGTVANQRLKGATIGLEHQRPSCYFWRVTLGYQGGKSFLNSQQRWYDNEIDLQAQFGYSFSFAEDTVTLTPYTGLGLFYDNEPTYVGNHFKELYPYIPVGLFASWNIADSWSVGLRSQINLILDRKLKNNNIRYNTENEFTWLSELPVTFHFKKNLDLSLVPFFHYGSNVFYENNGTSIDWGLMQTWGARVELGYRL